MNKALRNNFALQNNIIKAEYDAELGNQDLNKLQYQQRTPPHDAKRKLRLERNQMKWNPSQNH